MDSNSIHGMHKQENFAMLKMCELTVYAIMMSDRFEAFQDSCQRFGADKPGSVTCKLIGQACELKFSKEHVFWLLPLPFLVWFFL